MSLDDLRQRKTPLELSPEEFRTLGYRLVDRIAGHFESIREGCVTPGESPATVRRAIGADHGLPVTGTQSSVLLDEVTDTLLKHSLFNAHPRFWGYITSGPAPIGVLADLVASAVNPNVGAWKLAPSATEIEAQTVRWIAEFIGYPVGLRRPHGQRRKHGELRVFSRCPARESRVERTGVRPCRERLQPASHIRGDQHAHVDTKGSRPVRAWNRCDSLD